MKSPSRPAEEAPAHAAANTVHADGSIVWTDGAKSRREQAMAQRLLAASIRLVQIWQQAATYERP